MGVRGAGLDHWVALMDEPGEDVVELARAAERLGYRGVALPDHVAVPERFDSQHPSGHCPFDHRSDFPDALIMRSTSACCWRMPIS